jgi:hypothetical protein
MSKQLFTNKDWGVFIGAFNENKMHQHYAIQLSISIEFELELKGQKGEGKNGDSFLIKSNVPHQLSCKGNQVLFLINPLSILGHFLLPFIKNDFQFFSHKMVKEIETLASNLLRRSITYDFVIEQIEIVLSQFICECKSHSNFIEYR